MARIAPLIALALLSSPAWAAGEIPFETVKGWEIERSAPGAKGPVCLMSKAYKDADDEDAENALVFAQAGDQIVLSFVYEHWTWKKNEKLRVPLVLDKKVAIAKSAWIGDGPTLTAELPNSIMPSLLAAKTMVLKLDGADADFKLAGFAEAYEALRRCESTPASAAAAPAPSAAAGGAAAPATSAHIVQAMTFPGDGDVPPQTAFAANTPKIVLGLQVRDVKAGDKLTAAWIAEKTDAAAPNYTIASVAIPLGASPTVSSSLSKPDAGWPPGQYRVDVSYNGGPVEFSQRFTVKP
ncbi:hypothetical protein [Azorhizobium sp. AG788]|uniref:hypothetical protein n=1 Tax=Azorhizobium sp. AG788 TaxID=2183897 RepID=UPI00313A2D13